jgi:hypothetical protein
MMLKNKVIKINSKGQAMIAVLCIMAVVLAICFSLLLGSYQMFASVNDEATDEHYYQQALSLDNIVSKMVTGITIKPTDDNIGKFTYDFINDSTNYQNSKSYSFLNTNTNLTEGYNRVEFVFLKEDKSVVDNDESNTHGWIDQFIYNLTIRENIDIVTAANTKTTKASVATEYKVIYGPSCYTYYYYDTNKAKIELIPNGDKLTMPDNVTITSIDDLKKVLGAIKLTTGENITVYRTLKDNIQDPEYQFIKIGRV